MKKDEKKKEQEKQEKEEERTTKKERTSEKKGAEEGEENKITEISKYASFVVLFNLCHNREGWMWLFLFLM